MNLIMNIAEELCMAIGWLDRLVFTRGEYYGDFSDRLLQSHYLIAPSFVVR